MLSFVPTELKAADDVGLNVRGCWAAILGTLELRDDDDVGINVLGCQADIFGTLELRDDDDEGFVSWDVGLPY